MADTKHGGSRWNLPRYIVAPQNTVNGGQKTFLYEGKSDLDLYSEQYFVEYNTFQLSTNVVIGEFVCFACK